MSAPDDGNLYEYANGVLRNLFDIRGAEALTEIEATLTALRIAQLLAQPISGQFDLAHLKAIHHYIFRDVYAWAGELRAVDIAKGNSSFAHYAYLEDQANSLFSHLAEERYLRGLTAEHFVGRAAYYFGELNALHPFREGNGRTQRIFLENLANVAGYTFAWATISPDRMIAASARSLLHADNTELERILREIVTPESNE